MGGAVLAVHQSKAVDLRDAGMFRAGTYVAGQLHPVDAAQPQPNGVDLRVAAIFSPTAPGHIGETETTVGAREALAPVDGSYRLDPGGYIIRYREQIAIPEGHLGFLYPRSSLLRNGAMINTAVWDSGYRGRGEGLLDVTAPVSIAADARVAQLVLAKAEHDGGYDGQFQGEHLDTP